MAADKENNNSSSSSTASAEEAEPGHHNNVTVVTRNFSIGSSGSRRVSFQDNDYSDDDDDEEEGTALQPFNEHHSSSSSKQKSSSSRGKKLLFGSLAAAVVVAILVARKQQQQQHSQTATGLGDDGKCPDPFLALKPSSVKEGFVHAAVAADHPVCSDLGVSIMQDLHGNAIDAAVAVALCLGVANPASSGMGGGAFMLIHADPVVDETTSSSSTKQQQQQSLPDFDDERNRDEPSPKAASGKVTEVIDCREVAPSAAYTEMYKDKPDSASTYGGLAIGVPGELKGLELAHARHGQLPWSQVVGQVAQLARKGVVVNDNFAHEIEIMANHFASGGSTDHGLKALLTKNNDWGHPYVAGDRFRNTKLAALLEAVAQHGSDALYKGEQASKIAKEIQNVGGIVTQEDIENYRATLRSPVYAHHIDGHSIAGVPPPSSGGAAIIGAARFLAGFSSPFASAADALSVHRLVEAGKHAFAIRMSLSDPVYNTKVVQDAVNDLVNGTYMEDLRRMTRDTETLPLSQYGGNKWAQLNDSDAAQNATDANEGDRRRRHLARRFGYLEDNGTSHFSIVDKDGNAVAMTTSVNTYFGSKVVSPSTGIVFSNTMDDFSNPGRPNYFGLHPSPSNYIKPGKKPLSSMSPTMVFKSHATSDDNLKESSMFGDLKLVLGASGGPKIITAVLQVYANIILLGLPLFTSISKPRVHDQLIYHGASVSAVEKAVVDQDIPNEVSQRTRDALMKRNHNLIDIDYTGTAQVVAVDLETKSLSAGCDIRKGGSPSGF